MNKHWLLEIQEDLKEWSENNFGSDRDPELPLLGIVEEVGELAHAQLKSIQKIRGTPEEHEEAKKDAVGDIVIFLLDWCFLSDVSVGELETEEDRLPDAIYVTDPTDIVLDIATASGRLTGAHLDEDEEDEELSAGYILLLLRAYCMVQDWDFRGIVENTWEEVKQRDWVNNPRTGTNGDDIQDTEG